MPQLPIADLPAELRQGQQKAIPALIDHFHDNDRGILWMCCGSGKTVASAIFIEMQHEDLTVVFTPYIHLVKQWMKDYLKWLPTTKAQFMCVCSEKDPAPELDPLEKAKLADLAANGSAEEYAALVAEIKKTHGQAQVSTDPNEIAAFLGQKGRKVVFCTYASSPTYGEAQALAGVRANFGVFDEAQWTATGNKMTNSTHALHNDNIEIEKRLFTTATIRHYTRDGLVYSMDNEAVYGGHVLVDEHGEPDPWTLRQAIKAEEAPPYRIVISFVTDPTFDPKLVQLPPWRDLLSDIGEQADPEEMLRRIGQAMAMERLKEKYGVKKPLGFFNSVAMSRLYTDILNAAKKYPEHFPHLSKSNPAVSISTYEGREERRARTQHMHDSHETEINNARLFLFGMDENTIDSVFFGDPMTSNNDVIQAAGRALRYIPGKMATLAIPAMLPYYGNDLEGYARHITRDYVHNAYRYLLDILDSLADMDPILRDQIVSGVGQGNGNPGIIEFDFPEGILPPVRRAITTEMWREINPETDFVEALRHDREALDQYRLQKYPKQNDPVKEAETVQKRANIKIIPKYTASFERTADRMSYLRRALKAYYEAECKEGKYLSHIINAQREEKILQIYGWDKVFVVQDDFEELLKQDAVALDRYRLRRYPPQDNPQKEAEHIRRRAETKIIPKRTVDFEAAARRMGGLRRSLKAYYEADCKEGRYGHYSVDAMRAEQICRIYGWDKAFIMQDDFEELLKQDAVALDRCRSQRYPPQDNPQKEAEHVLRRAEIKTVPQGAGFESSAYRMGNLRRALKAYYKAGCKEGKYISHVINAQRERQVLQIYGWDKDFIMQDDFEAQLKEDAAALERYRLQLYPRQDNPEKEAEYVRERANIKTIPQRAVDFKAIGRRIQNLLQALKAYYKAGCKEGKYTSHIINVKREEQILRIYGWDKAFVVRDDFEGQLKEDAAALDRYRLQLYPRQDDSVEEAECAQKRSKIKIVPHNIIGFEATARRMGQLRRGLKAYYKANGKEENYEHHVINAEREEQILETYGWDKSYVMQDDFEAQLKEDAAALDRYRLQLYPRQDNPEKEAGHVRERAEIKIASRRINGFETVAIRMWHLRKSLKAYYKAGGKEGTYNGRRINAAREKQILEIYGWTKEFVCSDAWRAAMRQGRRKHKYHTLRRVTDMFQTFPYRADRPRRSYPGLLL